MATFRITKESPKEHIQGTYASAAPRGFALGAGNSDGVFAVAASANFLGFLTNAITANGPALVDTLLKDYSRDDAAFPNKVGDTVSVCDADQVEVSGSDYIDATNAVDENSAVGTRVSFLGGKFREAQEGDYVQFIVTAQLGDDADGDPVVQMTRFQGGAEPAAA